VGVEAIPAPGKALLGERTDLSPVPGVGRRQNVIEDREGEIAALKMLHLRTRDGVLHERGK
jgi:hypothetical protein